MDIIKFSSYTYPTLLEGGEIINGIKNKMWIERYAKEGEFKFSGLVSSGLKTLLPIGSYISHTNTSEVMIVENHEINEDKGTDPEITITGRGFETIFEQRIVGSNKTLPAPGPFTDYVLADAEVHAQIVALIEDHILEANTVNDDDAIPYISVMSTATGGESEERTLPRESLYKHVSDLLAEDTLGIKVVRPGPWSPLGLGDPNIAILIHRGTDLSGSLIFSHEAGEIASADYLWSMQKYKNAILVTSTWAQTMAYWLPTGITSLPGHYRRMMYLDYPDIDKDLEEAPEGIAFDNLILALEIIGRRALRLQKEITLTKADVVKEAVKAKYRVDYDVGDVVTVRGDYNESSRMRVTEYVEIEDENGASSYPTLELEPT